MTLDTDNLVFQLENDLYFKDESHERRLVSEMNKQNALYQLVYFVGSALILMYLVNKV